MILIFALAAISSISGLLDLPVKLTEHALELHQFCLLSLPKLVENHSSLEALVCGKNMQDLELKHLLMQTSLIHIFIVSGSHFLFLHKILAKLPIVRFCPLLVLSLYCLATLCQPPGVRSLVFLTLASVSQQRKLFITPTVLVFISCAVTVCIFPQWISSRSLLMSLMAALVIAVMNDFWGKESSTLPAIFLTQSAIYLTMSICLWGFSNLHPLSILLNLVLGPLIGGVIFPLALLVVLVPSTAFLFDDAMSCLIWTLQKSSEVLGEPGNVPAISLPWQWFLFLTFTLCAYFYLVAKKRRKARNA
jgi:predicted membrane metal-binding protein